MKIPKISELINYNIFQMFEQPQKNKKLIIRSNNTSFVVLIFEVLNFQNISCCTFHPFK